MLTGLQAGKEYSLSTAFPTWAWSHPSTELSLARSLRRIKLSNPIPLIYSDTPHHGCAYTATNLFIHPQTFLWVNKWNEGIILLKKKFNLPLFWEFWIESTAIHLAAFLLFSVFCFLPLGRFVSLISSVTQIETVFFRRYLTAASHATAKPGPAKSEQCKEQNKIFIFS